MGEPGLSAECKIHGNDIAHLQHAMSDHEGRIRELEKATWRMTAYVSVAASLFSALGAILAKVIGG